MLRKKNMNESSRPIGFLDSGIGGITVLNKALKLMPNENYILAEIKPVTKSKRNAYKKQQ